MELDSMKERMETGVKARLRAGKANTGQDRYVYIRIGEAIHLVEGESLLRTGSPLHNFRKRTQSIGKRIRRTDMPGAIG